MRTYPVCGMEVDGNRVAQELRVDHSGRYFYFCSTECRDEFIRNPQMYNEPAGLLAPHM